MKRIENTNYCPRCGKPVEKALKTSYEEDKTVMKTHTATDSDRCMVITGSYELNAGETVNFSDIGRELKPETAEIYIHEDEQ